jgi:signal peptidase II
MVATWAMSRCVSWGPLLRIRLVTNRRESFGRRQTRAMLVLIWFAALASATILYRSGAWFHSPVAMAGLGLAFGGASGNLLDVLRQRYIIDFIDLGWWPVFNLADLGIVTGLIAALCWHGQD